jgi:hypothetical protein
MTCAGSLFLTDLPVEEENPAAREGTAAGEYLQHLLEGNPNIPTHAKNGVPFDSDMKFHVTPIAEEILAEQFQQEDPKVRCEQRIDWRTRSGITIRGSYDISFVKNGNLHVEDLKYGWGIVEVKENWQLLGYAIGEVMRRGAAFPKIILKIRQPRPHHEDGPTRELVLTYPELLAIKERIELRMIEIAEGDKRFVTSPKCRYCPGAAEKCTAMNNAFYRGVEVIHEFMQDNITERELANQLDLIGRVSEVLKIKSDSLTALAVNRIKEGKLIPGYITDESYSDRKWNSDVNPDMIKALTGKDIIKKEMLSPAQAEKLGISKEFVNSLVTRHFLGMKIKRGDVSKKANKIFGTEAPK